MEPHACKEGLCVLPLRFQKNRTLVYVRPCYLWSCNTARQAESYRNAAIKVSCWSGTGNTEAMAAAVKEGAAEKGAEAVMLTASKFDLSMVDSFDAIAFGFRSMGSEELEDSEFASMFNFCKAKLGGKKIALFGSYGWGDVNRCETGRIPARVTEQFLPAAV